MVTGYPNVDTASDTVRLGAFDYLSKPVRQDTLLHTARMALQHKTLQDENERYRSNLEAIFRSVKDAIITVDKDLMLLEVNEAAEGMCGIGSGLVGTTLPGTRTHCCNKCLDIIKKSVSTSHACESLRTECDCQGRRNQVVSIRTSPLVDSKGVFIGVVMVVRDETRLNDLERTLRERSQFHNMIGRSKHMQKVFSLIEDLADVQTTVLITGESGTGKELVADAIHYSGKRVDEPLVKVNCSALSESLLESELFGHVKGAFTGADRERVGRFQKADGGTIFLDEIGDISSRMQLRLLRVMQEKEFEKVGDSTPIKVDVRVITATNQDLARKVKLGEFREDLYYRLRVVELSLPPLRERSEDIMLLVDYFLHYFNKKFQKNITAVSQDVQRLFMEYAWPGNVRELEHTLEHAFVIARQDTITVDQLPGEFRDILEQQLSPYSGDSMLGAEEIRDALVTAGGNKSKAARILGINVRTIYRKIDKYSLEIDEL
jgi:transcriptional regulator with PAS, ATPase and Fis domain